MPGICANVGAGNEINFLTAIRGMLDRMRHHDWYVESRHVDQSTGIGLGRMSLGIINTASQPVTSPDGSLVCVMDGELYDMDVIRRDLDIRERHANDDNLADILLRGWQLRGNLFLRQLNGSFVAAIWDVRKRRLTVITDRFATRPLYYAHPPGRFVVASSIAAIMADPLVSANISSRGLSQFFTFGQCLANDTLYESVRVVPAAACLTYDAEGDSERIDSYWSTTENSLLSTESEAEQLEQVDTAFKAAIDRRTNSTDRLGIALSGGLDARTILGVLDHERVTVKTVCLGMIGSRDHRSSKELADIVGCEHLNHRLDSNFLSNFETHLRDMVRLTDGQYLSQCIIMPTLPIYRGLGIQALLRGHGGELLHMRKAYNYSLDDDGLRIRSDAQLEAWLSKRLRTYLLDGVDGPLFGSHVDKEREELANESLRACLEPLREVDSPLQRIWHLFVHQRLRRETMVSMAKFNSVIEPRLPYLDNDFVSLVLSLPTELKLGESIQAYILRKRCPEFLKVPNTNTGTIVGAGRARQMFASLNMRILSKLGAPGYQPYERMGLWLRQELAPVVKQILLSERCLDRGVFSPLGVKRIVSDHLANRRNHTFLLLALMTFELGQQLMENQKSAMMIREMSISEA